MLIAAWFYWNRPFRADMAQYVPADCLGFVEVDKLPEFVNGMEGAQAWQLLAGPLRARSYVRPNRWLVQLARWSGFGSTETVLAARSQLAVALIATETTEADTTVTIKPMAALVIETHTTQWRMRPALERYVERFARRVYGQPVLVRKQIDGNDLAEWSSPDGARHIVTGFVDTVAIVGNDESSVLRCIEVRRGKRPALAGNESLGDLRKLVDAPNSSLFGFVSRSGVKPFLRAFALSRATADPDSVIGARILADITANLTEGFAWSMRFVDGAVEDRFFIPLAEGVADRFRNSLIPEGRPASGELAFVPPEASSVSIYHFRDLEAAWRDLNVAVSSHADLLGAIASRPLLQGLLKPYGIDDPEMFVHAVGTRIEIVRFEENFSASVLISEALDHESLRKLAERRLGPRPKIETVGEAEMILSNSDNWSAGFADDHFLIGPADAVRRCLQAKSQSQSLKSVDGFRQAQRIVDVSLPITIVTYSNEQQAAISFVELFSQDHRSVFSSNAPAIDEASRRLPYAVRVTLLKGTGFECTSRSSFGLLGSVFVKFAPERANE